MKKLWNYVKRERVLFIAVMGIFFLTLILTCNESVNFDETFSMDWTALSWKDMWKKLVSDVHPPLFYIALKSWRGIWGSGMMVARIFAAFSFLGILSTSFFVKEQFGTKCTVWYLSFLCGMPFVFQKAVEVRMYGWTSFWVVLNGIFLYQIMKTDKSRYWKWFCFTGLMAAYNHYYGILFMIVTYAGLGIWILFEKKYGCIRRYLLLCFVTVVLYLPWLVVALKQVTIVNEDYWIEWPSSRMGAIRELFYNAIPGTEKAYMLLLCAVPLICFISAIYGKIRKKECVEMVWGSISTFALWGCWGIVIIYMHFSGRPVLVSRYLIPGVYLFILGGCAWVKRIPRWAVAVMTVGFVITGGLSYADRILDMLKCMNWSL